jgi:hypothetical protein
MTAKIARITLLVTLSMAGCAQLPDSGPVERVVSAGSRTHGNVRYEPAPPRPGATALQIVDGYLDAMLAYPEATAIVQSYLTPEADAGWRSTAGMTVYSSVITEPGKATTKLAALRITARELLTVDSSGQATVNGPDVARVLRLERVDGQWRIANPVPGYLVTRGFADDYLRSYPLWYFDESGERLVPELIHVVVSEQLPLTLTRRLAAGPQLSTLRTYLPGPDDLRVSITGKIVNVDFRHLAGGSADKMAAQLISTLRGVPGLDGVRVLVDGAPQGDVHPIDAVVGFGPGPLATRAYALRGNRVVDVTSRVRAISGPWGRSARNALAVAVDGEGIAAVLPGRTTVVAGARQGGRVATFTGTGFADPSWDDAGWLWLIDQEGGTRVRVVRGDEVRTVSAGDLGIVGSFAVAPDRSRYAAVIRSGEEESVVVGAIQHNADGEPIRLLTPRVVSDKSAGERAVGWESTTRIGFVATGAAGQQLYSVGLDGADLSTGDALMGGVDSWAGAAADRADRWAADRRGQLWHREPGGPWRLKSHGHFRALSSGR